MAKNPTKPILFTVAGLMLLTMAVTGCGTETVPPSASTTPTAMTAAQLYALHCAECHGVNGEGTKKGNPVSSTSESITGRTLEQLSSLVQYHRSKLGFTAEQVSSLAAYLKNDLK
jgi:mono/diheme cytochrome c family protein